MVQSGSERVRGSSLGLRESEFPVSVWRSRMVLSGSEGVGVSSQGLRELEGPVGSEGVRCFTLGLRKSGCPVWV